MSSVSFALMGPSNLLNLPQKLSIICCGMFINGGIVALGFINMIPEIMECI